MNKINVMDEIESCKALRVKLSKRYSKLAASHVSDHLTYYKKGDKEYYSEAWYEDGKRKKRYLGDGENEEVLLIKEKVFISKAVDVLEKRIRMLEKCEGVLGPFDPAVVNEALPKVYRVSEGHLRRIVGPTEEEKWYERACKKREISARNYGVPYPERRVHTAKDGTKMRSKSEVAIANELINRGIPYVYEMPVDVGFKILHPDFSFFSLSREKVMMWEHAGMLGDPGYMADFSDRMDEYIKAGYVPCVDILFSFDTEEGEIDSRMINALIDEYR